MLMGGCLGSDALLTIRSYQVTIALKSLYSFRFSMMRSPKKTQKHPLSTVLQRKITLLTPCVDKALQHNIDRRQSATPFLDPG